MSVVAIVHSLLTANYMAVANNIQEGCVVHKTMLLALTDINIYHIISML